MDAPDKPGPLPFPAEMSPAGLEGSQSKLVLPAPPVVEPHPLNGKQPSIRPEQLIRPTASPAPRDLFAKIGYFWRKDPAYKVLFLAVTAVVLAGLFFVSLASSALLGNFSSSAGSNSLSQNPSTGASPSGTVDLQPSFPAPGGGSGSTVTSQPPSQSTPSLSPTANPSPSPSPGGNLTVQITHYPHRVNNYSLVSVNVMTSEPGMNVKIRVTYNPPSSPYVSLPVQTDNNGNASLPWFVQANLNGRIALATIVAIATDSSGNNVRSTPVTAIVMPRGQ